MKTRLLVCTAAAVLLLAIAATACAQANTLAFMEQALFAKTWESLDWLGKEYGVFTVGCECYGEMYGNLSVGGFAATKNATVTVDEALGEACTLTFESGAYDAVKAALVARYGDPQTNADADPALTWTFQQAEVRLTSPSAGELTLTYTASDAPAPSLPTFPPPSEAIPVPTREPHTAALAQENTFAFLERASVADSWEALLDLMRQYGLHGFETGCYADILGDLSIGGADAEVVMILCGDLGDTTVYETTGYDYDLWFEPEDYDAIKAAFVARYGEPQTAEESDDRLVWSFRQTEVRLMRFSRDSVLVGYYLQPTADETKPAFPPTQAILATPAPAQTELGSLSGGDDFVALMEQTSLAYSREALGRVGARHGFTVTENKRGARFSGSLAVGKHAVLHVDACSPEGLPGFDCYAFFEPDAFDAVRAALTRYYGEPVTKRDAWGGFAWYFAEMDIALRHAAGMLEVCYRMRSSSNDFYPSFPPLLDAVAPVPTRIPQTARRAEAGTLEFLEQALQADSWRSFMELGKRYGITAVNADRNIIRGDLPIAGFSATKISAYDHAPLGFSCSVEFEPDAYDAVLEALVNRYGDPKLTWERNPSLSWDFRGASVHLYKYDADWEVILDYSANESTDASLPTFSPPQSP